MGEHGINETYSKTLQEILVNEFLIFEDIIDYWSCKQDELEDCFYITEFIRKIKQEAGQHKILKDVSIWGKSW